MVYQIISSVIMLLFVPMLTGTAVCRMLSIRKGIAGCWLVGHFTEWAVIQLISVPLILLRCRFTIAVIAISVAIGGLCIYGIVTLATGKSTIRQEKAKMDPSAWLALAIMAAAYIFMAYSLLTLQYNSNDDSRFVVYGVDIVRTDRMFLTNPCTGEEITGFLYDIYRDAVSPWAIYMAYVSRITTVPVAIFAHTILVQVLLLCMLSVYLLLAEAFFRENRFAVYGMAAIAVIVTMFGVRAGYDAEAFAMTTLWQGKGTVSSVGIQTVFLSAIWIFQESEGWKKYIFLYLVVLAMCLMSGMGIIFSGIMTGAIGLGYGLAKKQVSVALKIWIGTLIPLVYYGITMLKY